MAESLFPAAFVETAASCSGPRYVRSQASRESGGVLLNECEAKYVPQFELPHRNISRYIGEIQQNWDKITPKDKELITKNLVQNLPQLAPQMNQINAIQTNPTVLTFLRDYVSLSPYNNTKEVLNSFYYPEDSIKQALDEQNREEMKRAVRDWVEEEYHVMKLGALFLLVIISIIVASVYTNNKK